MTPPPTPSRDPNIRQEAADWVARLQRPGRNPNADAMGLQHWAETSPDHAEALAEATQIWEELKGAGSIFRDAELKLRRRRLRIAAGVALAAACLTVAFINDRGTSVTYSTPVGGQQQITLADGSLVFLDSNSRVVVKYTRSRRLVNLPQGSAYFKVAKNAARPFIVETRYSITKAVGTAFLIQNSPTSAITTLVEGRVLVSAPVSVFRNSTVRPVVLYPGQLWTSSDQHVYNLSKIAMEKALAWQSGRLFFDNESLSDAAEEFNRYSSIPIVIETENAARVRISGIFNIHDEQSFTSAVSAIYGLNVVPLRDRVVISGTPQTHPASLTCKNKRKLTPFLKPPPSNERILRGRGSKASFSPAA